MSHCDFCGDHIFPIIQVCCPEGDHICILCCSKNEAFNPSLLCIQCERAIGNKKYTIMKSKANQFFTVSKQAYYTRMGSPSSQGNLFVPTYEGNNISSQSYTYYPQVRGANYHSQNNEAGYYSEYPQCSIYKNNHETPRNKSPNIYSQSIHRPSQGTIRLQNEGIKNMQQIRGLRELCHDQTTKKFASMEIQNQYEDQIAMNQFYTGTIQKKKQKNIQENLQYNHKISSNYRSKMDALEASFVERFQKRRREDYSMYQNQTTLQTYENQRYIEKEKQHNIGHKGKFISTNKLNNIKQQNQSPDFNHNIKQDVVSFGDNRSSKSPTFYPEKDINQKNNYSPNRIARSKSYCVIPKKHSK